jgi:hypothetical protein
MALTKDGERFEKMTMSSRLSHCSSSGSEHLQFVRRWKKKEQASSFSVGTMAKAKGVQVVLRVQGGQGDDASLKVGLQVGIVNEEQRPKIRSTVLMDMQRKEELESVSNRVTVRHGTCAAPQEASGEEMAQVLTTTYGSMTKKPLKIHFILLSW